MARDKESKVVGNGVTSVEVERTTRMHPRAGRLVDEVRPGSWCFHLDLKKVGIWHKRGSEPGEFHAVNDDGTTGMILISQLREVRKAKLEEIPVSRVPRETPEQIAFLNSLGYL